MTEERYPTVISVESLMNVPGDEHGPPDDSIERCDCGALFPKGGWHRCRDTGERVEWEDYTDD